MKEQPEKGSSMKAKERRVCLDGWSSPWNTTEGSSEMRTEACLDLPAWRSYSKGSSSGNQTGVAKEKEKCQEPN